MTQLAQMKLVLLYSMNEMGGGGKRHLVLQHINNSHYWYKDDTNDIRGRRRPSEAKWRNNFSYERQHLVRDGYMRAGGDGNWVITERGKDYLHKLIDQARNMSLSEGRLFTLAFYQKISAHPSPVDNILDEEDQEARYIARMAVESVSTESAPIVLSNEPEINHAPHILGDRMIYPRDPAVAK